MTTKFTTDHEWVSIEGKTATVGITVFAQEQLGDIVFVELPDIDDEITKGDQVSVVESVKAAGEVKSPVSGTVTQVNDALDGQPELVNESAEENGWIYKLDLTDESELNDLMDFEAYQAYLADQ